MLYRVNSIFINSGASGSSSRLHTAALRAASGISPLIKPSRRA